MPTIADPAHQARASARGAAKRQAWAKLKRAAKLGALNPLEVLNQPAAQGPRRA
jgi:hypothetical protein